MNHTSIIIFKDKEFTVWTESLGQFTGLLDKNCKKIFENDFVFIKKFFKNLIIKYDNDKAAFIMENDVCLLRLAEFKTSYIEIIGNTYDGIVLYSDL